MIRVSTDTLKNVAQEINNENDKMHNSFESTNKIIKSLSVSWKGSTASKSIASFEKIEKIEKNRNKILKNFSRVLTSTVAEQYEIVEQNNTSLADSFK